MKVKGGGGKAKSGKGSHGSLTKAGKIRSLTPRHFREEGRSKRGIPFYGKKSKSPRCKNRQRYKIATMCPACSGTHKIYGVIRTPIRINARTCWKCGVRLEWKGMRPVAKKRDASLPRKFS